MAKLTYTYEIKGSDDLIKLFEAEMNERFPRITDTCERVARKNLRKIKLRNKILEEVKNEV